MSRRMPITPPRADTPESIRWWAKQCSNYGGLERAFNEAADALEANFKRASPGGEE